VKFELPYGSRGLSLDVDDDRVAGVARAELSPWADRLQERMDELLDEPLGFPRLERGVVPGDRVAVVVGSDARGLPVRALVGPVVERLVAAGVEPQDVVLLGSLSVVDPLTPAELVDWASQLGHAVSTKLHDPAQAREMGYLASTSQGQRVYLDQAVVDADVVVLVGQADFDPIDGYVGARRLLWPGLSDVATIRRHLGEFDVSAPAWGRPDCASRGEADEVGWLLGAQFTVLAVTDGYGVPLVLLAGEADAATNAAHAVLNERLRPAIDEPADLVVCCVPRPPAIDTLGAMAGALDKALRWVRPGGHVALVGPCAAGVGLGRALPWFHDAAGPGEILKALRAHPSPEATVAGLLAAAVDRVHVYLLSDLPDAVVEKLFLTPLDDVREIERLAAGQPSCAIIMDGAAVLPDCAGGQTAAGQSQPPT